MVVLDDTIISIRGRIKVMLPSLQARRAETMVDGLPRARRLWPWPIGILATFEPIFLRNRVLDFSFGIF